jgi:hypothetical protein
MNLTLPVGMPVPEDALTVAVSVTLEPEVAGLELLETCVAVPTPACAFNGAKRAARRKHSNAAVNHPDCPHENRVALRPSPVDFEPPLRANLLLMVFIVVLR